MGAPIGLLVGRWKDITVAGNTLWAYDTLFDLAVAPAEAAGGGYKVDGNTYLANGKPAPFKLGGQAVGFDAWQAAGFDRDGRLLTTPGGRPAGNKVFLFPNKYQKGRAHVGVLNWDGADRIAVDLSPALEKGQKYSVYNCLDVRQAISMAKPVVTGTFDGAEVVLPLPQGQDVARVRRVPRGAVAPPMGRDVDAELDEHARAAAAAPEHAAQERPSWFPKKVIATGVCRPRRRR